MHWSSARDERTLAADGGPDFLGRAGAVLPMGFADRHGEPASAPPGFPLRLTRPVDSA
jgi:hypothetical protein